MRRVVPIVLSGMLAVWGCSGAPDRDADAVLSDEAGGSVTIEWSLDGSTEASACDELDADQLDIVVYRLISDDPREHTGNDRTSDGTRGGTTDGLERDNPFGVRSAVPVVTTLVPCGTFSSNIGLGRGWYAATLRLVDEQRAALSFAVPTEPFEILLNNDNVVSVDFGPTTILEQRGPGMMPEQP